MWNVKLTSDKWYCNDKVYVRGYAYVATQGNEICLQGKEFADYLDVPTEREWQQRISECNGLFAVVRNAQDWSDAALDASRIYPLYYRMQQDMLFIVDNPYLLLQKGDVEDSESIEEYMAMAAPASGKTLVENISQIKPAHYLCSDNTQKPFYRYLVRYSELEMPTMDIFESILQRVFERVLQFVNGNQIVVPLSGGNDSRLILCMLRRLNYKNVICYTIGRPDNWEKKIAEKVAKQLRYPIFYIDTTTAEACSLISTDNTEFIDYSLFIGNLGNFVWLFEFPAIHFLQERGVLQPNAVFIPGHSADFNAGSHLQKGCISEIDSIRYLTSAMMYDNCEYQGRRIKRQIENYISCHIKERYTSWSVYQSFIFQNRLPHNINNSARIYEYFGYDVCLPFWDREFLELFRKMPYEGLKECCFYTNFICNRIFTPLGVNFFQTKHPISFYRKQKIRKRLKALLPAQLTHTLAHLSDTIGEYELMQPLLKELIENGKYKTERDFCSNNQVIRDWYLMKVRQLLEKLNSSVE